MAEETPSPTLTAKLIREIRCAIQNFDQVEEDGRKPASGPGSQETWKFRFRDAAQGLRSHVETALTLLERSDRDRRETANTRKRWQRALMNSTPRCGRRRAR